MMPTIFSPSVTASESIPFSSIFFAQPLTLVDSEIENTGLIIFVYWYLA